MAQFLNPSLTQMYDASGNPRAGAKLYIYEVGTTTLLDLFSDEALSIPVANPIIADSSGLFSSVYVAEFEAKTVLTTSADVTVKTQDKVFTIGRSDTAAATTITYDGGDSGLSAENVQDAIDEIADQFMPLVGGTFIGPVSIVRSVAGESLTLESTAGSADSGPDLELYRNSASPAASDDIGSHKFTGENDAGDKVTYAQIVASISDETDTSEDGVLSMRTIVAGTEADRVHVGAGVYTDGVSGGDPGAGKINATEVQQAGVAIAAAPFAVKAWVSFNGTGTPAIRGSYNVSSITDNGTGDYTINFTTAMANANYAFSFGGANTGSADGSVVRVSSNSPRVSTSAIRIFVTGVDGTPQDTDYVSVVIFA